MPRAKRGFKKRRRTKQLLKRAEGFVLRRKNTIRRGAEAVDKALAYSYRDRKNRKRTFRQLWIARLSAATSTCDMSYSRFIAALKAAGSALDRKVLSDIAIVDPAGFKALVDQVRTHAPKL